MFSREKSPMIYSAAADYMITIVKICFMLMNVILSTNQIYISLTVNYIKRATMRSLIMSSTLLAIE